MEVSVLLQNWKISRNYPGKYKRGVFRWILYSGKGRWFRKPACFYIRFARSGSSAFGRWWAAGSGSGFHCIAFFRDKREEVDQVKISIPAQIPGLNLWLKIIYSPAFLSARSKRCSGSFPKASLTSAGLICMMKFGLKALSFEQGF